MYERRSRLSKAKRDRLVEHFVAGTTAPMAAPILSGFPGTRTLRSVHSQEFWISDCAPAQRTAPQDSSSLKLQPNDSMHVLHRPVELAPFLSYSVVLLIEPQSAHADLATGEGHRLSSDSGFRAFEAWRKGLHGDDPQCPYGHGRLHPDFAGQRRDQMDHLAAYHGHQNTDVENFDPPGRSGSPCRASTMFSPQPAREPSSFSRRT